jgi:lipoate-protein ligase A
MRVIRSASKNVFSNLAMEEWLLVNRDLSKERILYIYENSPSVIIGRHQVHTTWKHASRYIKLSKKCSCPESVARV